MNIDYIKNVQAFCVFDGTTNKFLLKAPFMPTTNPADTCIIKQINFNTDQVAPNIYSLWTDICNDYVASFITRDSIADVTPKTLIKLDKPIVGDITFVLNSVQAGKLKPITDIAILSVNMEFIRYKQ